MTKICTDIKQSKKLIELGIDVSTSDCSWILHPVDGHYILSLTEPLEDDIPCWSLAALMDVLERGAVFKTPKGWACQTYIEYKAINSNYHSNPVDACVEMILELHKQKDK